MDYRTMLQILLGFHAYLSPRDVSQTPFVVALSPSYKSLLGIIPLHLPLSLLKCVLSLSLSPS
jgi:hypothetical protein